MIDLGTPDGGPGFAEYINDRGDAVGAYRAPDSTTTESFGAAAT
jgi:hypothetical protein